MRSTRSKAHKQSKIMQILGAPFRILAKARDFYVKSMADCADRVGYGGVAGGPVAPISRLPKSFSVASSNASDNEEYRVLIRSVSKSNTGSNEVAAMGPNGMGIRSYSVGIGRIGRIDEEEPCEFVEEVYPRSRSHAVTKRTVVYY
ncbi:hypothetical protein L1049_015840 [Liquidambar formosana]|uniref:Uncharacterized protein n=1 Tax=Liquidambar formosana TaxID=63359 RepID=A0AAP0S4R0_LIQFO